MTDIKLVALGHALEDARLNMGEEGGNNRGRYVADLLSKVGLSAPAPWCAAAVWMWFANASLRLGLANPLHAVNQRGLVQSYYDNLSHRIIPAREAEPGCLALFRFPSGPPRWNHIALVVRGLSGASSFVSVEGNTSELSNRDGDKVEVKSRRIDGGYDVIFIDPTRVWVD